MQLHVRWSGKAEIRLPLKLNVKASSLSGFALSVSAKAPTRPVRIQWPRRSSLREGGHAAKQTADAVWVESEYYKGTSSGQRPWDRQRALCWPAEPPRMMLALLIYCYATGRESGNQRSARHSCRSPTQMAPAICLGTWRAKPDRFLVRIVAALGREASPAWYGPIRQQPGNGDFNRILP